MLCYYNIVRTFKTREVTIKKSGPTHFFGWFCKPQTLPWDRVAKRFVSPLHRCWHKLPTFWLKEESSTTRTTLSVFITLKSVQLVRTSTNSTRYMSPPTHNRYQPTHSSKARRNEKNHIVALSLLGPKPTTSWFSTKFIDQ